MNLDNITYRPISHNETYSLRHKILRQGQSFESCKMEGDTLDTSIHLGLYHGEIIIGIVSSMSERFHNLASSSRIRGMAILAQYRDSGLGSYLLEKIEGKLKLNNIKWSWLKARENALSFYVKNSYVIIGEPFNLPKIGLHYNCVKAL